MAAKKNTAQDPSETSTTETTSEESVEEALKIAYYYDHAKNTNGGAFPGVPLRHLSAEEVAAYPEWVVRSIEASDMYSKTAPASADDAVETESAADSGSNTSQSDESAGDDGGTN